MQASPEGDGFLQAAERPQGTSAGDTLILDGLPKAARDYLYCRPVCSTHGAAKQRVHSPSPRL